MLFAICFAAFGTYVTVIVCALLLSYSCSDLIACREILFFNSIQLHCAVNSESVLCALLRYVRVRCTHGTVEQLRFRVVDGRSSHPYSTNTIQWKFLLTLNTVGASRVTLTFFVHSFAQDSTLCWCCGWLVCLASSFPFDCTRTFDVVGRRVCELRCMCFMCSVYTIVTWPIDTHNTHFNNIIDTCRWVCVHLLRWHTHHDERVVKFTLRGLHFSSAHVRCSCVCVRARYIAVYNNYGQYNTYVLASQYIHNNNQGNRVFRCECFVVRARMYVSSWNVVIVIFFFSPSSLAQFECRRWLESAKWENALTICKDTYSR